ncbi:MAG: glycosyltransferase family 4 protein [Halobacteriota archaeon]|jgi:glycosyltransferase involved in cell wall biosynthesis
MNSAMNSVRAAVYAPYIYRWMLDFVRELSDLLGEVRFYSRGTYGNYPWKQYEQCVRLMNKQRLFSAVIDYLRYRPDFIILLGSETPLSLILYLLSKIVRTNLVLIVEENREKTFASVTVRCLAHVKRLLVVAAHRNAAVLVAESEPAKEYLLRMGCASERVNVIPHGTNTVDFQPGPKSERLAKLLGLSANDLRASIILFVGEFSEYKGAEFMAQAILTFPNPGEAIFLIPSQGSVFLKHESHFSAMKNVHPYPSLDDECMPHLYNLSDIVVVPSKQCETGSSDRSPNSLIEAMACGKAVIGTAVGGIPAIMDQTGLLIRPNDPAAIVQAISALTADTQLREILGKEARTRAVTTLNNNVYARRIFELWKRAAHG